jgi:hypothetical protein
MAKKFICKACNKGCVRGWTHMCDQTCSDCMSSPPCVSTWVRIPCDNCNRHFRSQTCFDNHKQTRANKKSVCERKRICESCGGLVTRDGHECNRRYCATCGQHRETGHLCFIKPLQNEPVSTEKVLYVFYDFEPTQDAKQSEKATVHVPNLVCVQQFCSQCESIEDVEQDCSQ